MTARAAHVEAAATEGTPIPGAERWRFDPKIDLGQGPANQFVCRGVAHWARTDDSGTCADRIFASTSDARLIALDAATGQRCVGFGEGREVRIGPGMPLLWRGEFQITSPPVTVGDTVVDAPLHFVHGSG